jgi:heparan-alpha-glucosaminide N-acetyltransferase
MSGNSDQGLGPPHLSRITSIDALRGFVMFMMIFVNDLAGAPAKIVPDWMSHFSDRHQTGSGMTFVDLVFPAFLFLVGMSIPFALGSRLNRGEARRKIFGHVAARTLALLALGLLMVNGESGVAAWWWATMFTSGILAFCTIRPPGTAPNTTAAKRWNILTIVLRTVGLVGMVYCAFVFQDHQGNRMLTLSPFYLNTSWYGILGLIGWAYLAAAILFLIFRTNRTALLGCVALMTCFYTANQNHFFDHFWPARFVDFGGTLGSQAAITVAGVLLASILVTPDMATLKARVKFTLLFIAGFALGALLWNGLYGISKDNATPSWCLWSCAITATLWLGFHFMCDVKPVKALARPLAIAGQNVLLAYLLSEMMESVLHLLHLGNWYDHLSEANLAAAIARSAGCGILILLVTAGLNRLGFRLKL